MQRDAQAGVYVATSGDVRGLVCEAATMDALWGEINSSAGELLALQLAGSGRRPAIDLCLPGD